MGDETSLHSSCVALGDYAVLLRGVSGSGKSDLALRLIDAGWGLVADDQTRLRLTADGQILAYPPDLLAGLLEVRGFGLMRLPFRQHVPLLAVFDLVPRDQIERYPELATFDILGISLPLWQLDPFSASAVAKIRLCVANQVTS
ncbi:MAG: HPr kinase/phosphatase C-terminal domain-containing protein [Alphaproteobacteria bacterium]|nr:HPr kinase/phosphatase C-terminal domain-containing protein [Alphaproteobacteria bacterium]